MTLVDAVTNVARVGSLSSNYLFDTKFEGDDSDAAVVLLLVSVLYPR